MTTIVNPKPLAIRAPPDPIMDSITNLKKKFTELVVQVTSGKDKRPKSTNQRTNIWCSNCRGHGHLPTKCPTLIGSVLKALFVLSIEGTILLVNVGIWEK